MIKALKMKLFLRQFNKLSPPEDNRNESSFNLLSSFTLLASSSSNYSIDEVSQAVSALKQQSLKGKAFYALENGDKADIRPHVEIINEQDYNWYGVPNQSFLVRWLAARSDILIVLNPTDSALLKYLCAVSGCRLKTAINFGQAREDSVDFYLSLKDTDSKNPTELCELILDQLRKIAA
jgi:hypothetical protein